MQAWNEGWKETLIQWSTDRFHWILVASNRISEGDLAWERGYYNNREHSEQVQWRETWRYV